MLVKKRIIVLGKQHTSKGLICVSWMKTTGIKYETPRLHMYWLISKWIYSKWLGPEASFKSDHDALFWILLHIFSEVGGHTTIKGD